MRKPKIAIDIDDVLARGTESLRLEVNKRLKVNLLPEHYLVEGEYWNYYEHVWKQHGLEGRIAMKELNAQMVTDQSHIPPHENALEALNELSKKYDFIVITARDTTWEEATRKWLHQNFPGIFQEVYFAGREDSHKTKGEICTDLGVSWLVDDNIDHAHTALDQGVDVVLFGEYGWHKGRELREGVVRCKDWREVREYFDARS